MRTARHHRASTPALVCGWVVLLAACSSQKQPAEVLIGDIRSTVMTAAPSAGKYAPGELGDVERKLQSLETDFNRQNYAAVLAVGPAVFTEAQTLMTVAAAKQAESAGALNAQWNDLVAQIPGELEHIQLRVAALGDRTAASKRSAGGIDVAAARVGAGNLHALWSKAQGAFAAGNLTEAVSTADEVRQRAAALASAIEPASLR